MRPAHLDQFDFQGYRARDRHFSPRVFASHIIVVLLMGWFWLGATLTATAGHQVFDYSGKSLGDVLTEMAKKMRANIIADVGVNQRLSNCTFRTLDGELEPDAAMLEEAFSMLATIGRFEIIRQGPFLVLTGKARRAPFERRRFIARTADYRSAAGLADLIKRLSLPHVQWASDSVRHIVYLSGFSRELRYVRMLLATIDTPVHTLWLELSLTEPGGNVIASCSARGLNHQDLRWAWVPESSSEPGFDVTLHPNMNDDGHLCTTVQGKLTQGLAGPRFESEQTVFTRDRTGAVVSLPGPSGSYSLAFRISAVGFPRPPRPQVFALTSPLPTPAVPDIDLANPDDPWETEQDATPANSVRTNVPVAQLLNELAARAGIELLNNQKASGTLSLFFFGPAPAPQDVARVIAGLKGWGFHGRDKAWVIAEPKAITEIETSMAHPVSFSLPGGFPAPAAAGVLSELFDTLGISGRVTPGPQPTEVSVQSSREGLSLARFALNARKTQAHLLPATFQANLNGETQKFSGALRSDEARQHTFTAGNKTLAFRFSPLWSFAPEGFGLEFGADLTFPGRGVQKIRSRSQSRPGLALPWVTGTSPLPFSLHLHEKTIAAPPEPTLPEGSSDQLDAFDSAFDSSF
jgi:hypothetical protein